MRSVICLCLLLLSSIAFAQTVPSAEEVESRAREVGRSLRCVVCQNQSIEESDAALAKDMRVLVRERISVGATDAEIIEFMRLRYGDYVLLKPPLQKNTYLLWFLPALTIFGMGIWLIFAARRQKPNIETPRQLTEAEQAVLKRVMDDNT